VTLYFLKRSIWPGRNEVLFFLETGRFSKKNREAIEHEPAITERD
jgi:hypothetical protein